MQRKENDTGDERIWKGLRYFEEALLHDRLARTAEDYAGVEELLWMAFNALSESSEKQHRETCTQVLERLAVKLEGEGRLESAGELRSRADRIRRDQRKSERISVDQR